MRLLVFGRVVGGAGAGREAVRAMLAAAVARARLDFVVGDGENAAGQASASQQALRRGSTPPGAGRHQHGKPTSGPRRGSCGKPSAAHQAGWLPGRLKPGAPGTPGVEQRGVSDLATAGGVLVLTRFGAAFRTRFGWPLSPAVEGGELGLHQLGEVQGGLVIDFHGEAPRRKMGDGAFFADGRASMGVGTPLPRPHARRADLGPRNRRIKRIVACAEDYDSVIGVQGEGGRGRGRGSYKGFPGRSGSGRGRGTARATSARSFVAGTWQTTGSRRRIRLVRQGRRAARRDLPRLGARRSAEGGGCHVTNPFRRYLTLSGPAEAPSTREPATRAPLGGPRITAAR